MPKNKGRPSKLNETFLSAAKKVIEDGNSIYCTDDELLFLINEELEEKDQICERTFQYWKAAAKDKEISEKDNETLAHFLRLLKKALIKERNKLFEKMKEDNIWQRWAWILERKFSDWNLKVITESKSKVEADVNHKVDTIEVLFVDSKKSE